MGHSRPLFLCFRLFYIQLRVNECWIKLVMSGFEPGSSGVGSDNCGQIGLLLKSFGNIFSYKISPNIRQFLSYFKNIYFIVKNALATFWATLVKIGLLLILVSGYTVCHNRRPLVFHWNYEGSNTKVLQLGPLSPQRCETSERWRRYQTRCVCSTICSWWCRLKKECITPMHCQ